MSLIPKGTVIATAKESATGSFTTENTAAVNPHSYRTETWFGLEQMLQVAERDIPRWPRRFSRGHMLDRQGTEFNESPNLEATGNLIRFGWKDGVERIYKLRHEIITQLGLPNTDFEPMAAIAGGVVEVPSFLAGHPLNMIDTPMEESLRRDIDISVDINISCTGCRYRACQMVPIPAEATFMRGAAVAMLVEALERSGHRVTVRAVTGQKFSSRDGRAPTGNIHHLAHNVILKQAHEYMNLSNLVFALAHTAMMTQVEFGATEYLTHLGGMSDKAYYNSHFGTEVGKGMNNSSHSYYTYGRFYLGEIELTPTELKGDIHIPSLHAAASGRSYGIRPTTPNNRESAAAWILEQLAAYDINLNQ